MKMYYYQSSPPNFGDELNTWLWPRILPSILDDNPDELFLGIGSILFDFFPADQKKIVFGAGYAGYTPLPKLDERWKFYFVRGRMTAERLKLDPDLALGDAAILVRGCAPPAGEKKFRASFMPHWESGLWGAWPKACAMAGIHYLDPSHPVEDLLAEIRASRMVVTEAMHGAIVSDALRVPWVAIEPFRAEHRMKWHDWASALDLEVRPLALPPSTALEWMTHRFYDKDRAVRLARYRLVKRASEFYFLDRAARALDKATQVEPSLSADRAIERAHERMLGKVEALRNDRAAINARQPNLA